MVPTRWGDREARRRDILAAGRLLLAERGLTGVARTRGGAAGGIALGTVYSYFPTKESLFSAMYAERLDEFLDEIGTELARTGDIEELFVVVASNYRRMYQEFGSQLDVLFVARSGSPGESPVSAELIESAGSIWRAVRGVVERAGARDPDQSLTVLWSTITGLADHFTGVRQQLHSYSFDGSVRYAAKVFAAGIALERGAARTPPPPGG